MGFDHSAPATKFMSPCHRTSCRLPGELIGIARRGHPISGFWATPGNTLLFAEYIKKRESPRGVLPRSLISPLHPDIRNQNGKITNNHALIVYNAPRPSGPPWHRGSLQLPILHQRLWFQARVLSQHQRTSRDGLVSSHPSVRGLRKSLTGRQHPCSSDGR